VKRITSQIHQYIQNIGKHIASQFSGGINSEKWKYCMKNVKKSSMILTIFPNKRQIPFLTEAFNQ
jgi:hypothetical protein